MPTTPQRSLQPPSSSMPRRSNPTRRVGLPLSPDPSVQQKSDITKPLCVKWLFLDALSGAGVPAWGVGLGVARGDLAEEPVFRM